MVRKIKNSRIKAGAGEYYFAYNMPIIRLRNPQGMSLTAKQMNLYLSPIAYSGLTFFLRAIFAM